MLGWAVTFLIIALIAALLGFGGIAGVAIEAAKIVFFVAIVLFAISLIAGLVRGRTPTVPESRIFNSSAGSECSVRHGRTEPFYLGTSSVLAGISIRRRWPRPLVSFHRGRNPRRC